MSHHYTVFGTHIYIGNEIARHGSPLDHFWKLAGELCCIRKSVANWNNWLYWDNSAACTSSFLLSNKVANKPWYVLGVLRWEDRGKREVVLGHIEMRQPLAGRTVCMEQWCWEIFWDQLLFLKGLVYKLRICNERTLPSRQSFGDTLTITLIETVTLVSGWRVTELHFHDTKEVKIGLRAPAAYRQSYAPIWPDICFQYLFALLVLTKPLPVFLLAGPLARASAPLKWAGALARQPVAAGCHLLLPLCVANGAENEHSFSMCFDSNFTLLFQRFVVFFF